FGAFFHTATLFMTGPGIRILNIVDRSVLSCLEVERRLLPVTALLMMGMNTAWVMESHDRSLFEAYKKDLRRTFMERGDFAHSVAKLPELKNHPSHSFTQDVSLVQEPLSQDVDKMIVAKIEVGFKGLRAVVVGIQDEARREEQLTQLRT